MGLCNRARAERDRPTALIALLVTREDRSVSVNASDQGAGSPPRRARSIKRRERDWRAHTDGTVADHHGPGYDAPARSLTSEVLTRHSGADRLRPTPQRLVTNANRARSFSRGSYCLWTADPPALGRCAWLAAHPPVGDELRNQGKEQPARLAEQAARRAESLGDYLQRCDGDTILGTSRTSVAGNRGRSSQVASRWGLPRRGS